MHIYLLKKNTVEKYLSQFGHAIELADLSHNLYWDVVLIVPVCGENPDAIEHLMQKHNDQKALVVVCINRPEGHEKTEQWCLENKALKNHLMSFAEHVLPIGSHQLLQTIHGWDCLLLNFNDKPFSAKAGVGLARKIAADTALALINRGQVGKHWIHSTDADVVLPTGYFDVVNKQNVCTAISLPFEHVSEDKALLSYQEQYDFKLYYYQWGMKQVGSAYDYIPLGSTLIVAATAYAQVRGFPIKSGGEDFYLLNKLVKLGSIAQPRSPVIEIASRLSDRVPFGTGPAVIKYQSSDTEPLYYHPETFQIIKNWRIKLLNHYHDVNIMNAATNDEKLLNDFWSWPSIYQKNINKIKTETRWKQFIHEWLDAFKLLKSVHFLRQSYPEVSRGELRFYSEK